ncbi:hypothetical protein T552_04138 [Pneumocystis carinii B80]|uniref:TOG domain-containing protein n=1 Tax=Pneumocystis carinii (strain B80) TaxID=1408658 RepID=A0A0W4ZIC2_PNEC8|nr:hypothetical protein T552_04138 [Pneumocystis carinii B80]KTW28120.1 hypothetical protein T552_04138 [Pneumocystis carinii B80]
MVKNQDDSQYKTSKEEEEEVIEELFFLSESFRQRNVYLIKKKLDIWIEEVDDTSKFSMILNCLFKRGQFCYNKSIQLCIQHVILKMYEKDKKQCLIRFIEMLDQETTKMVSKSVSPYSIFILLKWVNKLIINILVSITLIQKYLSRLVSNQAILLNLFLSSLVKARAKSSALRSVEGTLRSTIIKTLNENAFLCLNIYIDELIKDTKKEICMKNTILLGMIAKITYHSQFNEKSVVMEKKDKIISYYINNIIESRVLLPNRIITGMNDFFIYFITFEDFKFKIASHLEKALLRTPEITLNGILKEFLQSLPSTIKIDEIIHEKFLIPILNSLKSTDSNICENALQTFEGIIQKCNDQDQIHHIMEKIIQELNSGLLFSLEHKLLFIKSLACLPKSLKLSNSVLSFLSTHIHKKANENISIALIKCFFSHFTYIISTTGEFSDKYIELIKEGFLEGTEKIRRTWFSEFGNIIWDCRYNPNKQVIYLIEKLLNSLLKIYKDILANPLQTIQSGTIIDGYVCTIIFFNIIYNWKDKNIDDGSIKSLLERHLFSFENNPHFILWEKNYTKISHKDEKIWLIRSLETIGEYTSEEQFEKIGFLWAQASFSLLLSNISHDHLIVSTICGMIKRCYLKSRELVLDIFLSEIWKYIKLVKSFEFKTSNISTYKDLTILDAIFFIINSISPSDYEFLSQKDKESFEKQLIKTIVLYHHSLLKNKLNWVKLCKRNKMDPFVLVTSHALEFVNTIDYFLQNNIENKSNLTLLAIQSSISTLTSLDQAVIVPLFVEVFLKYLSHLELESISEKDLFILKDKVDKKMEEIISETNSINLKTIKNTHKDKLNKNRNKLNKNNEIFLKKQIEEEAIRTKILNVKLRLISGLTVIQGLALAIQKSRDPWYFYAVNVLLSESLLEKGSLIDYESTIQTYLNCAKCTPLKDINTMIGIAMLHILNVDYIHSDFVEEPLNELVVKLLLQLDTLTRQCPIDKISFIYISPFLIQVIKNNGIGTNNFNESDKQVMLAVDILSFHIDFYKFFISRLEIIQALLNVLCHFPNQFNHAKDCLILLSKVIKDNITKEEILEFIKGSLSSNFQIRNTVLQAIESLDLSQCDFFYELYLAAHDKNEINSSLSLAIIKKNNFLISHDAKNVLINYLCNDQCYIRECASKAISSYVKNYTQNVEEVVLILVDLYEEKSKLQPLEYDEYGIPISRISNRRDPWEIRSAIASSFFYLIPYFTLTIVPFFLEFLLGMPNKYVPLKDNSSEVREKMLKNGLSIISYYGDFHVEKLFKILDNHLISSDGFLQNDLNEAVIILYAAITSHLKMDDRRIPIAIGKLMNILKSPSENIQIAIAESFSSLIKFSLEKVPNYIERLKEELFTSEKYAERKGAAYGLAGVIKGGGIELLEEYDIIETLKNAITNKKDQKYRQGALFAIESFSQILEQAFESYIIEMIPYLLTTFGDPVVDIRESTSDTAKTIMGKVSGHGMKSILPSLLLGLEENNWRSKKGSIDFLSSMAYCSPYQLSSSLPIIIPRLTEMINDSHLQVRSAANDSLLKFSKIINNPEIQKLIPTLLKSLSNPNEYTELSLDLLLGFSFKSSIDSTLLAMIMPVLEQGLKERSATSRKKAVKIIEKISSLIETSDFIPYLDTILISLRKILVDPVPATRETSAKALGTLVKNLGGANFPHLIPDLLSTLKKDISSIERHGSSQGISEILSGLNIQYLEDILPQILENSLSSTSYIKEGYISLFIYLPQAFGPRFQPYIGKIVSPILLGLADDSESVRDVSLSAGKVIIDNYSTKAVDLLLPELQKEIFNENWKIRLGSVQLISNLLFHITGISGKVHLEENINASQHSKNFLLDILGQEKRDSILASLYILRQDSIEQVRSSALNIWKALVINTSKTVKEVLPVIINMIIQCPNTLNKTRDSMFIRTLGELVKKLEDVVSSMLLPLQESITCSGPVAKVRLCIALIEIIQNSNIESLEPYKNGLIKTIHHCLMDIKDVRATAAQMFSAMYELYGNVVINQILPNLLDSLYSNKNSKNALEALKELIYVRPQNILPILIPKITKVPLSDVNAKIINSFARVHCPSFKYYFSAIINALVDTLIFDIDAEIEIEVKNAIDSVLLSVYDPEGMNILIPIMLGLVKDENWKKQVLACQHLIYFFKSTKQDYSRYFDDFIYAFLSLFDDQNDEVVKSAWEAQNAFTSSLKKIDMENLVGSTQKVLNNIGMVGTELKAFKLPNGINAILPIFLQGMIFGNAEKRELAAIGISDIIERANSDMLSPFVVQITGPLIRTMGEWYPVQVKLHVLHTLKLLLRKVPSFLRPFLPQLQRTFLRCLADPVSDQLRSMAASLLEILATLQSRIDPLISQLVNGSNNVHNGIKLAMIKSLFNIISNPTFSINDSLKNILYTLVEDNMYINDPQILSYIGRFSMILFKYFDKNNALVFLCSRIFLTEHNNYSILTLNAILVDCSEYLIELDCCAQAVDSIINGCLDNKPYIANNSFLAAGKFLLDTHFNTNLNYTKLIIETLVNCMKNPNIASDSNRLILTIISCISKKSYDVVSPHFNLIVPIVFQNVHHILTPIQLAAESAFISLFKITSYDRSFLNKYIATLDSTLAKSIAAYHKRIITKITSTDFQNHITSYCNDAYNEIMAIGLSFTCDLY